MKYIKKFESNSKENFIFAINIENITTDQVYQLKEKILTEFPNYQTYGDFDFSELMSQIVVPQFKWNKPWALIFNVYYHINDRRVSINRVVTYGWGAGYDYMYAIVPLDEFLKRNLDEIKEYVNNRLEEIEMKRQSDKYNL